MQGCGDEVVGMLTDVLMLHKHENKEFNLANAATSNSSQQYDENDSNDDDDF